MTLPRAFCGGKIPQLGLCPLMLFRCVGTYSLDEHGMALYQNSEMGAS